jgi:glycosyltransferase involved in cell wall biosynthesis
VADRPLRVSVCLATYNGAAYVAEQLASVLAQLGPDDEVVIVDDASTDDTPAVIRAVGDPRIRLEVSTVNRGYAATFEQAISEARGGYLLLSDQDDVWAAGRVDAMRDALRQSSVVVGNIDVLGSGAPLRGPFGQRSWRLAATPGRHGWRALAGLALSNVPYYGSAMGLRADFRRVVLPFPPSAVELHDGWLGINGLLNGSIAHLETVVTHRRVHTDNTSGAIDRPRSLARVAHGRVLFVQMVREARRRRGRFTRPVASPSS